MNVTIISGAKNSGKTTTLNKIISNKDINYLGYLSESLESKNKIYLRDIKTGEKIDLMQTYPCLYKHKVGKYYIHLDAFENAEKKLLKQIEDFKRLKSVVVLDEVGYLELLNLGFNDLIEKLICLDKELIMCVRDEFVPHVISKYNFKNCKIKKV